IVCSDGYHDHDAGQDRHGYLYDPVSKNDDQEHEECTRCKCGKPGRSSCSYVDYRLSDHCTSTHAAEETGNEVGDALSAGLSVFIRSEEHTSELQSRFDLVCRLLLE